MEISRIFPGEDWSGTVGVRKEVFCDEQGYPEAAEFDADDPLCWHIVISDGSRPVAVGRICRESDGVYKIGRIAVLKPYRGRSVGRMLVSEQLAFARELGAKTILLGAQVQASGFYRKMGFSVCGDEYMDGHVPHVPMKQELP